MINDPIVDEVRSARQKIFAECNEDLEVLLDRFQEHEKLDKERVVSGISTPTRQDTEGFNRVHP
ncbi:MAG: hypothetical protein ACYS3S_20605 [Planctomycetota bacterium]|jgi:hypothetical protein